MLPADVDWALFYIAALSWGIQPSEFWLMSPEEWWLIYETKRPRDPELDYAGSLDDRSAAELLQMLEDEEWRKSAG